MFGRKKLIPWSYASKWPERPEQKLAVRSSSLSQNSPVPSTWWQFCQLLRSAASFDARSIVWVPSLVSRLATPNDRFLVAVSLRSRLATAIPPPAPTWRSAATRLPIPKPSTSDAWLAFSQSPPSPSLLNGPM